MSDKEWFFAVVLSLSVLHDLYSYIFQDKIQERIYRRTVEDINWNREKKHETIFGKLKRSIGKSNS
jgi:hypothetical protein